MFVPNIRTATGGRHSDESSDDSDSSDESKGSESDSSEHGETSSERDGSGSDTEMVKYETTNRFGRTFTCGKISKVLRYPTSRLTAYVEPLITLTGIRNFEYKASAIRVAKGKASSIRVAKGEAERLDSKFRHTRSMA